jgi:site-specific DNA-methyltransferase (adenine-specific)
LDPFGGSGTTLAVAKKLGRQWIGFELSKDYVAKIKVRLKNSRVGGRLDGSADPLSSAPSTAARSGRRRKVSTASSRAGKARSGHHGQSPDRSNGFVKGIIDAYRATHKGFSVDFMLADAALDAAFLDACKKNGLSGDAVEWNRALLRIRKAGELPRLDQRTRKRAPSAPEMDLYCFASEVAMQQLCVEFNTTLDNILCDPKLAAKFDELAQSFSPGYSPIQYRWAALAVRKRARDAKQVAKDRCQEWLHRALPHPKPISDCNWKRYECSGVYLLASRSRQQLYVGESLNLGKRLELTGQIPSWQKLEPAFVRIIRENENKVRDGLQSILIGRVHPLMNLQLLALDPEAVT